MNSQIRLHICAVWSVSLLSSWRNISSLAIQNVHREDSDQTAQMIWIFAGRRLIWILAEPVCPKVCFLMLRLACRVQNVAWPRWLSSVHIRLVIRPSLVRSPLDPATSFRGDWSWNIFYGHSLPSADSRKAVVSFWWKNVLKYWLTTWRTKPAQEKVCLGSTWP